MIDVCNSMDSLCYLVFRTSEIVFQYHDQLIIAIHSFLNDQHRNYNDNK